MHEEECEHNKDNLEESDYEEWVPHTVEEGGCLDGRKIVMMRKKPERKCFNPEEYTLFYIKDHCECTNDDYHCDFGYSKNDYGYCILDPELNDYSVSMEPKSCHNFYFQ